MEIQRKPPAFDTFHATPAARASSTPRNSAIAVRSPPIATTSSVSSASGQRSTASGHGGWRRDSRDQEIKS